MAANPATLQGNRPRRPLPKWAPIAGVGLAGLAFIVWRRSKSSAAASGGSTASPAAAGGGAGSTGVSSAGYSAPGYGSPAPVSVLPPLTINGAPSTDQQGQTMPLPIRSFPPGGAGGTNPAPSLPQNPAPSQPAPAPPAEPQNTQSQNLPADLLARIQAGGENIIGSLRDPLTGGTWYLGSKGGIFAVGGARFLGSARQYGFDNPAIRSAVNITPLGTGYRVTSSRGETYDFAQ